MDIDDMLRVCQLLNLNLIHNFVSNIKGHICICVDKQLVCRAYSTHAAAVVVAGWMVSSCGSRINTHNTGNN